jgi:hypothetical protein
VASTPRPHLLVYWLICCDGQAAVATGRFETEALENWGIGAAVGQFSDLAAFAAEPDLATHNPLVLGSSPSRPTPIRRGRRLIRPRPSHRFNRPPRRHPGVMAAQRA